MPRRAVRKLPVAVLAILLAMLLLAPTVDTLADGVERLSSDLASGRFSPFSGEKQRTIRDVLEGAALGGFTGSSEGNYVPGSSGLPNTWEMDRIGFAGTVTIDYVCQPALGAMKRLKAYDTVGDAPDYELSVKDETLRPATFRAGVLYDTVFRCSFPVELRPGTPTPLFAPGPDAIPDVYSTFPRVPGGLEFLKDGADTFYADAGDYRGRVTLNVTWRAPSLYYRLPPLAGAPLTAYPAAARPVVDAETRERAELVLARAGVKPEDARAGDVAYVVRQVAAYFNAFGEGAIPGPEVYDDLYLALGLGEVGCCRHRAFAFMVTMHAIGVPTRVVVNEAHAFAEVRLPDATWRQVNLGGCGRYEVRNPDGYVPFYGIAASPRAPPAPENDVPVVPLAVEIGSAPDLVEKGETHAVIGSVRTADAAGDPVRGIRVDLYLNTTRLDEEDTIEDILSGRPRARSASKVVGTGTTDGDGAFVIGLKIPSSLAPGEYLLRAHAFGRREAERAFGSADSESLTLRVHARTGLALAVPSSEGVGAPLFADATLRDAAGTPVAGEDVELRVDGALVDTVATDANGRARFRLEMNSTGRHAIEAAFPGTSTLGASTASRLITVTRDAIRVEPELALLRGEPWRLQGALLTDGVPVAGEELVARAEGFSLIRAATGSPEREITLRTNESGAFSEELLVAANAPAGEAELSLVSTDRGIRKVVPVKLLARPLLDLDAPREAYASEASAWRAVITLADDDGAPIEDADVVVSLEPESARPIVVSVRTNDTGVATSPLPLGSALAPGEYTLRVAFGGGDGRAPATALQNFTMHAGAPPGPGVGRYLAAGALVLGAAVVGGGAWAAKRRGWTLRDAASRLVVAAGIRSRAELSLSFPSIDAQLPDVWTPGEALLARVGLERARRDAKEPVAGAEVVVDLLVDGRVAATERARTDSAGVAAMRVAFPATEGDVVVRARSRGGRGALSAETSRVVRAADYRREVEREHRAFVARAARRGAPVAASSTPREIERAIAAWAPLAPPADLDAVASAFEWLVFTERPVTRREYAAFVLAMRRVEAQFPVGGASRPVGGAAQVAA